MDNGGEMVEPVADRPRVRPTYLRDDRELLDGWLEFHRATLLAKCEGLNDEQRKARPITSSQLSLHGMVRHLAETERNWFRRILLPEPDLPRIWFEPTADGSPLIPLDDANWDDDLATWQKECQASRDMSRAHSLEDAGVWRNKSVSLRSVYLHMIQEYARHNGHADLIRELLDGSVGL
jgi:uncharacterized damage-inducible protein DinB